MYSAISRLLQFYLNKFYGFVKWCILAFPILQGKLHLIRKKYSGEDEEIRQYFQGMYQSVEQLDNRVHTGNADKAQKNNATGKTSFADAVKQTTGSGSASRTEAYKDYLKQKYGNVRYESIGKDQKSLDRAGKSMSGNDVVIAPNILEQMANDPKKAAYYEGKIDDFFNATPMLTASFAAKGLVYEPGGVVVHEDGSVTYISGCSDSPERVAQVKRQRENAEKKEAKQRKEAIERSQKEAEERRRQIEIAYKKQSMAEALANQTMDTSRYTYTAAPEVMGSAITAYAQNIMEAAGILE